MLSIVYKPVTQNISVSLLHNAAGRVSWGAMQNALVC